MPELVDELAKSLREQLLWGLHAGVIRPGDRWPGVREIAERYSVDTRTALRACRVLAADGLLEMRSRSGTYVASGWIDIPCAERRPDPIVDLFVEGLRHGIPPARLPMRLADAFLGRRVRIACVGGTSEDAMALCKTVTADFAVHAFALSAEDLASPDAQRQLASGDGIVTTVFHLQRVRQILKAACVPMFLAGLEPAQRGELFAAAGPRYVIVAERSWAERATRALEDTALARDLHFLVGCEDDLNVIPHDAPVYVAPAAAPFMSGLTAFRGRVHQLRYAIQPADARRLIGVIVDAHEQS